MFKVTQPAKDRVDLKIDGGFDADTMRKGLDDLLQASEAVENGRMCYSITNFSMPSIGAIGVELARLPKLFGMISKFDRCAVLTDAGWIKTAAEIEGALIPGLEIKAFDISESDAAEAWLAKE